MPGLGGNGVGNGVGNGYGLLKPREVLDACEASVLTVRVVMREKLRRRGKR
jgi:hypothetical protein